MIYSRVIKAIALHCDVQREPHHLSHPAFLISTKKFIADFPLEEKQLLAESLCMKLTQKKGRTLYTISDPSRGKINYHNQDSLFCKVFVTDFLALYSLPDATVMEIYLSEIFHSYNRDSCIDISTLIYAVLQGHGYPASFLVGIHTAYESCAANLGQDRSLKNMRRHLNRKSACIEHAVKEFLDLDAEKESW